MSPPLPAAGDRWSLFLDLDGTLAEFAHHPDAVQIPPARIRRLQDIQYRLDGALAVVSGRSIDSIDSVLQPLRPHASGLHGLEKRDRGGTHRRGERNALDEARAALENLVSESPGLMLEDKGAALALHFRGAPGMQARCHAAARELTDSLPGHQLLAGKMVFEIKPADADKGAAIRDLSETDPFTGRRPVFAGDDVTDEDGFRWVNAQGGITIKVGAGSTTAASRLADVAALHGWLDAVHDALAGSRGVDPCP